MKKYSSLFSFFLLFYCFSTFLNAEKAKPPLGLWVPCESDNQTLSSRGKITQMLDFAKDLGAKDIFLQVYRRNHSWYRSQIADESPFQEIYKKEKMDPLAFAIEEAHRRNLKIHAWVNVYWIGKDLNVPIVKKLGRGIITRDQKARSMLDYHNFQVPAPEAGWYSYGEDGYWLDPGDDRVQTYLLSVVSELIQNYPGVDGIHFDFVRYPFASPFLPGSYYAFTRGLEFGYGERSVERFQKAYGLNPFHMERTVENHMLWDEWRRNQITSLIDQTRKMLRTKNSYLELSCAVLPWPERSYFSSFQDWSRWAMEEKVDFVVSMNYTLDLHLAQMLSKMALGVSQKKNVWIGLGAYLFEKNPKDFEKEFKETLQISSGGIVLFSYDSLLKQKEIVKSVQKEMKDGSPSIS
ncbi:MAG: family 10 glycosylhydrolase [Chlamydiae bacterium]|nr:family 10 glycosylhydrolase [Chlamydiota bacterium]MBI3266129.1 family 10 glycosylhydrolase [Chlamydiota bacterium]